MKLMDYRRTDFNFLQFVVGNLHGLILLILVDAGFEG